MKALKTATLMLIIICSTFTAQTQNCTGITLHSDAEVDDHLKSMYGMSERDIFNQRRRLGKFYSNVHTGILALGMTSAIVMETIPRDNEYQNKTQNLEGDTLIEIWTATNNLPSARVLIFRDDK